MTVNYNLDVSTSSPLNRFRIFFRWRGSLWKSLYHEFFIWCCLYAIIAMIFALTLSESAKKRFAMFADGIEKKMEYIPLNFMLSFFVTEIVHRWTHVFQHIGLIDNLALTVAFHIKGMNERARILRRNIVRYCIIAQVLVFRDVSIQVRKRFPHLETLVASNFMSQKEMDKLEGYSEHDKEYKMAKYWIPIMWARSACQRASDEGLVNSDIQFNTLLKSLVEWRTNLATVANYDWVPLPLMYPQLVFLAVHVYFYMCLIFRQITYFHLNGEPKKWEENVAGVFLTLLQFIFYVGWVRVAEGLLNPMGEDDDDFETNFILDRNLKIGMAIVDKGYDFNPDLDRDVLWDGHSDLLYTEDSRPVNPFHGSAIALDNFPRNAASVRMVPLEDELTECEQSSMRKPSRYGRRVSIVEVKNRHRRPNLPSGAGPGSTFINNMRRRFSSAQPSPVVFEGGSNVFFPPKSPSTYSKSSSDFGPNGFQNCGFDIGEKQRPELNRKAQSVQNLGEFLNRTDTSTQAYQNDLPDRHHSVVDEVISEEDSQNTIGKEDGIKYMKF